MENNLVKIESEQLENVVKESGLAIQEGEEKVKKAEHDFLITKEKAKRDAEKAPDKEKLERFAKMIDAMIVLNLSISDKEILKISDDAKGLLKKVSNFIRERSVLI